MQKNNYIYDELIECGKGKLFGEGNAKLPLPPMLMFDRITKIEQNTGDFKKGFIKAEVIDYENYIKFNGEAGCRDNGKLRIEGKEYIVQDGDVLHFRFNT